MTQSKHIVWLVAVLLAIGLAGGMAMSVVGQEAPASYYGEVDINIDDPADENVELIAVVDGDDVASIDVESDGSYGGPSPDDGKLRINSDDASNGDDVSFEVDGDSFDRTEVDSTSPSDVTVQFGEVQEVDIDVTVDVDDDDPSTGTGGGAGAPPATDDPDVDAEPPDPPADVDVELDETVDIEFDDETGQSVATFGEDNAVESITFGFETAGSVNARTLSQEPDETGPSPGASARVAQISVGADLTDSTATIRMRVSQDRIDEIDAEPEDLRVNRFADGEWQGLDSEVEETDDGVVVEAETPGFSYFSVSATSEPTAAIDVPADVEVGEEFTLDGSDSTDRYGEIVAWEWDLDGEALSGETATAVLDAAGEYTVSLTVENDAGETDTVEATVEAVDEPVEEPEEPEEPEPEDDGLGLTAIVLGVLVVAVLAAAVVVYLRRENGGGDGPLN